MGRTGRRSPRRPRQRRPRVAGDRAGQHAHDHGHPYARSEEQPPVVRVQEEDERQDEGGEVPTAAVDK
jgi:hypothetical protein